MFWSSVQAILRSTLQMQPYGWAPRRSTWCTGAVRSKCRHSHSNTSMRSRRAFGFYGTFSQRACRGTSSVEALELIELEMTGDDSLVPKNSDRVVVLADLVILAIGQSTHTGFLGNVAIELDRAMC